MANGKPRDMDDSFAIKILSSAKVVTLSCHGNPRAYGYQNQTFYDIARNKAVAALKENAELRRQLAEAQAEIARLKQV